MRSIYGIMNLGQVHSGGNIEVKCHNLSPSRCDLKKP